MSSTPPISLINKQEAQLVADRARKACVSTSFSLSLLNAPHLVSMHWAKGKIKMEGGEVITCTLILEHGATLAFTGCEMAEPFPKAAL